MENIDRLLELLGHEKDFLLNHVCRTITKDQISPSRFYKLFCKAIEMDKLLEV
jgi:hypothetical protein